MQTPVGPWLKDSGEFTAAVEAGLRSAHGRVIIVSAYLTSPAVSWLRDRIPAGISVDLIVRWKLQDLLSGGSDLGSWSIASHAGWSFRALQDLHAKIWLADSERLFIGSANATARGLGLECAGNIEYGVEVPPTAADIHTVLNLVASSVRITPALFSEIEEVVNSADALHGSEAMGWPDVLALRLDPRVVPERLWTSECFQTDGAWVCLESASDPSLQSAIACDLSLLVLRGHKLVYSDIGSSKLRESLRQTKLYRWLVNELKLQPAAELYFGALTARLHDSLADDPKPYRQTIKHLVVNLLSWIELIRPPEIIIDRPNHSQRIRLIIPN